MTQEECKQLKVWIDTTEMRPDDVIYDDRTELAAKLWIDIKSMMLKSRSFVAFSYYLYLLNLEPSKSLLHTIHQAETPNLVSFTIILPLPS